MTRPAPTSMLRRGVAFLFGLRSKDPDQRSRELVLRVLYLGTLSLSFAAFAVVAVNYLVLHLYYLGPRVAIIGGVTAIMLGLYSMILHQRYTLPSYALLAFYFLGATAAVWMWGAETPVATLLFALVVIFAGILLRARYSLYAMVIVMVLLAVFVRLTEAGIAHPDRSWAATPTREYDLIIFGAILGNIALISWLFNRSMQHSLKRAQRSERALLRQKKLLEIKVQERTRQVQAAHLEHMQELYRFAELGHLGVGLLHDLGNYLTVLSLDIEGLKQERENRATVIKRVQQSIKRLDGLIGHTRQQINGEITTISFNAADEIDQVCSILAPKADAQHVHIVWQNQPDRQKLQYSGSVNQFWQIMTNIISNAVDAYESAATPKVTRNVLLNARGDAKGITVTVTDFGVGIKPDNLDKIFEPFYSTKKKGMGVGLAIVKQMVEKNFGGTIAVSSNAGQGTTFTVHFAHPPAK